MKTFTQTYAALRRKNSSQYALLAGCCLFSVLLITAYISMMRSPTVLGVLPEGGDSRKQVMMIFGLAVFGCGVFIMYASSLFFRFKSREFGVFMALGASRKQLRGLLMRETAFVAIGSCAAGALLGTPLAWLLWQFFRMFVVDTQEMVLAFDPNAYLLTAVFSLFVIAMLFIMSIRFVRRTNIIDIVNEQRKTESIHDVPRWYGPAGIALIFGGGFWGYSMPSFFITVMHWYAPDWLDMIFYAPLFAGLYMVLLHTVVNGWRRGVNRYRHIISTSMMKFQGRQTVRNMLVITVLIAGAYFGAFYTPMLGTGAMMQFAQRPVDYAYHGPAGMRLPDQNELRRMADAQGIEITSWCEQPVALLGVDGMDTTETEGPMGTTWTEEYTTLVSCEKFLSESAYAALTGNSIEISQGCFAPILDDDGGTAGRTNPNIGLVTNPVTGRTLSVSRQQDICYSMLFGHYVLDDADYRAVTQGLTSQWQEKQVFFNVADNQDTYTFAKRLFYRIVDNAGPEYALYDGYDPIVRQNREQEGDAYFLAPENLKANGYETISYNQRDASNFRLYWKYMPAFRVLDQADFVKTTAVFLMLFIFIALVCFAAVIVIVYTRCMTIALNHRQVYEDLRHLGANRAYLFGAVRGQVSRVFMAPAIVGTGMIYGLYLMIMYFNDNLLTPSELAGMGVCAVLVAACSAAFYGIYRFTLRRVCHTLDI